MKSDWALIIAVFFIIIALSGVVFVWLNSSENTIWKFAVLCDMRGNDTPNITGKSGINDTLVKILSKGIANEHCDLVLVPGDMINGWLNNGSTTYEGQFNNWMKAMGPVYKNTLIFAVRGNHEDGNGNYSEEKRKEIPPYITHPDSRLISAFSETFGFNRTSGAGNPANGPAGEVNLTYSFTHKNAFFIGLDEYIKPHRVNQEWLDDQLKTNTRPFVFVFGHEPAFQINHPDCLAYYSTNRSIFWDSIGRAGCQIYFCGHDHLYDRAHILDSSGNKIYQIVIGSCGAPMNKWMPPYADGSVIGDFHNNNKFGYVLVTIQSNNTALVEWKAWDMKSSNWTTLDRFTLEGKKKVIWPVIPSNALFFLGSLMFATAVALIIMKKGSLIKLLNGDTKR